MAEPTDAVQNELAFFYRDYVQCQIPSPTGLSTGDSGNGGCGGPDHKRDPNDPTPARYSRAPDVTATSWTGDDWTFTGAPPLRLRDVTGARRG